MIKKTMNLVGVALLLASTILSPVSAVAQTFAYQASTTQSVTRNRTKQRSDEQETKPSNTKETTTTSSQTTKEETSSKKTSKVEEKSETQPGAPPRSKRNPANTLDGKGEAQRQQSSINKTTSSNKPSQKSTENETRNHTIHEQAPSSDHNKQKTVTITVSKEWDDDREDDNDLDPISLSRSLLQDEEDDGSDDGQYRPTYIKVQLYKQVAGGLKQKVGKAKTIRGDISPKRNWKPCKFENLPVEENGKPITYTVEEAYVPKPYVRRIIQTGPYNFTIINIERTVTAQILATKKYTHELTHENKLRAGQFEFKLYDDKNQLIDTARNRADGTIAFKKLKFDQSYIGKVLTYKIVESLSYKGQPGPHPNIVYDSAEHRVSIRIDYDDQARKMIATIVPETSQGLTFHNIYKPLKATAVITAKKILEGRELKANQYEFELIDTKTNNIIEKVRNDAQGNISFSPITYIEDEVGKHSYLIREVKGNEPGITYDKKEIKVTVNVRKDASGKLVTKVFYNKAKPTFTNKYTAKGTDATFSVTKKLTGRALKDGEFSFELKEDGKADVSSNQEE
ncbi:hypothetical protein SII_0117 [Streptococcus intermedius C270]|nr:hypothetical protein SII_0117 [Streptococcus intermedius C270]